jgi:NitT/TauT family transport system substrate-binding protein
MAITLQESLRGLFYAPFYAALALDAYRQEGLEVRFVSAPRPGDAAISVLDGAVDVCWGGPMRVAQTYHQVPGCDLVSFAEVVTRDPFFLVGQDPRPGFVLSDLPGLRVATVSEVPTPWLCLQEDLRRAAIDPASVQRCTSGTMVENAAALVRGELDVIQLFEPFVSSLLAAGSAHIWYAAADRGPTSYTTFYTRKPCLYDRRDELLRLVRGIARTQRWVAATPADVIASTIAPYFPDTPVPLLTMACDRYKSLGVWSTTPVMPRAGYDRLLAGLISGGFVHPGTPFEVAVDNSLAEEVEAELSAGG